MVSSIVSTLKKILRLSDCEKLIKYDTRTISFRGLSPSVGGFQISLADFSTHVATLRQATESAKALDDYQYYLCKIAQELSTNSPQREKVLEIRIAALGLLTCFRVTLEAFSVDPKGQKKNLNKIVAELREFAIAVMVSNLQKFKMKITTKKRLSAYLSTKPTGPTSIPVVNKRDFDRALTVIGIAKHDLKSLVEM